MSPEENKSIIRRFHGEVFSEGNLAPIDELCDVNWTYHDPSDPLGQWPRGPQGARQLVNLYRSAFPDLHFTIEDEIAEGDKVVQRWTVRGTHKGDLMGIPPTGKQVTSTGMTIVRIANGKIMDDWANFDLFGMLQQLGAIPIPQ
ncbi:MAG: ester cyclase [Ktedonobacteraceae bacterium]